MARSTNEARASYILAHTTLEIATGRVRQVEADRDEAAARARDARAELKKLLHRQAQNDSPRNRRAVEEATSELNVASIEHATHADLAKIWKRAEALAERALDRAAAKLDPHDRFDETAGRFIDE